MGFGPSDPSLRLRGLAPGRREKSGLARIGDYLPNPERPLGLTTRGAGWRKPPVTSSATESRPADGRERDFAAQVMGERVG